MRIPRTPRRHRTGFTLIEVLVVMAIVAVLAAVAYPAYTAQVARTRRAEAQAVMLEAAQHLERHYSASGSYTGASLPQRLSAVPMGATSTQQTYRIVIQTIDSTGIAYTLTAAPTRSDPCGTLVYVNTGVKSVEGATIPATECWK